MFGRNQAFNRIQVHLTSREGDQFVLTDEPFYFHHEPLNFSSKDEAWDFLFHLQLGQSFELEDKLKGHPLLKSYHHSPTPFLIRDALYRGQLNVFAVYRNPSRHLQQIEALYDQIKVKLGQIIASEKAEAAVINQQYQALDTGGKVQAHANRFGQGFKESVASLLTWMGEVHDVVSKVKQRGRVYEAYLKTQAHDSVIDWYREFNEHWREAEYKEIVDVLGFDPKKISSEDFTQAWTVANILWEDDRCQTLLTRFAKDYARAQHSLEISELAGSGAFEVLLTLVLAALTAGTGALVNITSKARLARQMTVLGELFSELAEFKKTVQKHTPKQTLRTRSSGDMTKDLPEDDRPAPKNNPPPKGENKAKSEQDSSRQNYVSNDGHQQVNGSERETDKSSIVDDQLTGDINNSKYTPVEVNGRKVYKNSEDVVRGAPPMVHRSVNKSIRQKVQDEGWTNLELMKNGYAPIGPDGKQINLHHILGKEPGPMVELTSTFHKKHHKPLHGLIEDGRSFRNDSSTHYQYEKFRKEYWKHRAQDFK